MGSTSGSGRTLLALIAAGDIDAAAGFYDARAASVRTYCRQLCREELVDEATLAAFADLRGRAATAPPDVDVEDVLRRASRAAAAGRFDLRDPRSDACQAAPELLAARMNDELMRDADALEHHLERCATCRQTAERLTQADATLSGPGADPPSDDVRLAWLELVAQDGTPDPEIPARAPSAQEPPKPKVPVHVEDETMPAPPPAPTPESPPAAQPQPDVVRGRARQGGLVGVARRLASRRSGSS